MEQHMRNKEKKYQVIKNRLASISNYQNLYIQFK